MKYLKKYNESNESGLVSELGALIDAGIIPDKDYLYECFSDLLDSGEAESHEYKIPKNILDEQGISHSMSSWWYGPFDWTLNIYTPAMNYKKKVYSNKTNSLDDMIEYHNKYNDKIEEVKSCIGKVKLKYPNYNIEMSILYEPKKTKKGCLQLRIIFNDGYKKLYIDSGSIEPIRDIYKKNGFDFTGT